jgi:hypothetical protein
MRGHDGLGRGEGLLYRPVAGESRDARDLAGQADTRAKDVGGQRGVDLRHEAQLDQPSPSGTVHGQHDVPLVVMDFPRLDLRRQAVQLAPVLEGGPHHPRSVARWGLSPESQGGGQGHEHERNRPPTERDRDGSDHGSVGPLREQYTPGGRRCGLTRQ